jgi:uncharacterized membrane protein YccC
VRFAPVAHWRQDLSDSFKLDRSKLQWRWAGIGAALTAIVVALGIAADQDDAVVAVTIGLAFTAIANVGDTAGDRWRAILWTMFWMSISSGLGQLFSQTGNWRIVFICVAGFVLGFIGAAGARSALIGTLSLVTFIIFIGSSTSSSVSAALETSLGIAVGGAIIFVAAAARQLAQGRRILAESKPRPGLWARIKTHTGLGDDYLLHGLRLSLSLAIACLIAYAFKDIFKFPHDYWVPMTVAWVAKPDTDGTVSRVFERILGTILGVGLAAIGLQVFDIKGLGLAVLVGLGTFMALTFVWSNYALAVSGVTLLILTLFAVEDDRSWLSLGVRILATIAAGVVVLLVSGLWRGRAKQVSS